jgi:hypothetical protein
MQLYFLLFELTLYIHQHHDGCTSYNVTRRYCSTRFLFYFPCFVNPHAEIQQLTITAPPGSPFAASAPARVPSCVEAVAAAARNRMKLILEVKETRKRHVMVKTLRKLFGAAPPSTSASASTASDSDASLSSPSSSSKSSAAQLSAYLRAHAIVASFDPYFLHLLRRADPSLRTLLFFAPNGVQTLCGRIAATPSAPAAASKVHTSSAHGASASPVSASSSSSSSSTVAGSAADIEAVGGDSIAAAADLLADDHSGGDSAANLAAMRPAPLVCAVAPLIDAVYEWSVGSWVRGRLAAPPHSIVVSLYVWQNFFVDMVS